MQPARLPNCDYLVVGAGAASLSFIDTLLTELPTANIVLVDERPAPGGHWVDDYDFVRLHQPSIVYGVASRQLEGNWMRCVLAERTMPWNHRAMKGEILAYFRELVEDWKGRGQVRYFPNCRYDFEKRTDGGAHSFSSLDGTRAYSVKVEVKLVNGVLGECMIPSKHPPKFQVDDQVRLLTPNELYELHHTTTKAATSGRKYIVLGCGKTAMDTVVFLQTKMCVPPSDIVWVIPNDVWMLRRKKGGPGHFASALLEHDGDMEKACLDLERREVFARLDRDVLPTRFRFPVIGDEELKVLRNIKQVIRRGRVTSITATDKNEEICVQFGPEQEPMTFASSEDHIFIHCTSPGPFNGNNIDELFVSDGEMNLALLFAPPVSISMSVLAALEAARRKGTLDIEFGRKLLGTNSNDQADLSENEVLNGLVRGFHLNGESSSQLQPLTNLALILALLDRDPEVARSWMKSNRLSFLSIPGFKCRVFETMGKMIEKREEFGFTEGEVRMFRLLKDKLQPLEGK